MLVQLFDRYCEAAERAAQREIADWATGNDEGVSSQAIVRHMFGLPANHWGFVAPSDESDRGRCIRLLQRFPQWIPRLREMEQYQGWKKQIPLINTALCQSQPSKQEPKQ